MFAVFLTNAKKEQDNGQVFNFRRNSFANDEDFMQWIEACKNRSIIQAPVGILPTDEMITLQTCDYDFEEARLIVMARKVRDGESKQVEIAGAKYNPKPLFPQAWYDKKGGKKPQYAVNSNYNNFEGAAPTPTTTKKVIQGITPPSQLPTYEIPVTTTMQTVPTTPVGFTIPDTEPTTPPTATTTPVAGTTHTTAPPPSTTKTTAPPPTTTKPTEPTKDDTTAPE
ncbi:MAG: hypothetical protein BGN88_05185 [Clostridiales bacterium 43-6]|nr:MAG: hypothetical protein BGN88_05185 [Clostridiales bacterium 43-6]